MCKRLNQLNVRVYFFSKHFSITLNNFIILQDISFIALYFNFQLKLQNENVNKSCGISWIRVFLLFGFVVADFACLTRLKYVSISFIANVANDVVLFLFLFRSIVCVELHLQLPI